MIFEVQDYYNAINTFAPWNTAENWDNVGILLGGANQKINRALVALDVTDAVLQEAAELGANLIITHHPVIFQPLKRIGGDSLVAALIRQETAVISAHTNLDVADGGVNDALAAQLGLTDITGLENKGSEPWYKITVFVPNDAVEQVYRAMSKADAGRLGNYAHCGFLAQGEGRFLPMEGAAPDRGNVGKTEAVREVRLEMLASPHNIKTITQAMLDAHPYEMPAYDLTRNEAVREETILGRVGYLEKPLAPGDFAAYVKERLDSGGVRYCEGAREIYRVAVLGGSGAESLFKAQRMGCHALVTSEVKHHLWLESGRMGITLVDAGHFATENVVVESLATRLREQLQGADIHTASTCTDGMKYV